jgi:flagellar basal-body rod protein FlgG
MYTAATAMLTYNRKMDVITNNLTNVETTGYKMDTMATRSFRDMLISRINDPSMYAREEVGGHNTGIHVDQSYTTFTVGALESTGVSTDFALSADGFFVVDYTDGGDDEVLRYTRAGAFDVDADGMLVTADGHYVLGEGGPINVISKDFTVNTEGTVYDSDGNEVDRLLVMKFPDNRALRKEGDNMYFNYDPEGNEPEQITNLDVLQGYLEGSNVDTGREMVNMMQTYRAYEINQRVLQIIDESLGRAVNDVARI